MCLFVDILVFSLVFPDEKSGKIEGPCLKKREEFSRCIYVYIYIYIQSPIRSLFA